MSNQDQQEEELFAELENLYRQAVASKKSEGDPEREEDLQPYYQSLQVSADASLETIREIYERLVSFWSPGQLADDPSMQEKSGKKVAEITQAYEKILAFRQREGEGQPAELADKSPEPANLFSAEEEVIPPFPWGKIFLGGAAFVVTGLAIFFWPTFFLYESIRSGNLTYQMRTNRITGSKTYFDGERWKNLPIPVAQPLPHPVPAAVPPALPSHQFQPAAQTSLGTTERAKVPNEQEASREEQGIRPVAAKGYAIQIVAMSTQNAAEEIAETHRKAGWQVYTAMIKRKDQGMLYGVYLGRFASKGEAMRFMKENKIKEIFPGCFIKKLS